MAENIEFTVREALPEDASAILNLIKGLCIYEKEPLSQVVITEKELLNDGLNCSNGEEKFFHCLVAETQRTGVGTALLKKLSETALEKKCARIMWMCLDWNTTAKDFYAKIGAEEQNEWRLYHFRGEQMKKFL
eukprot:gene16046-17668_t